MCRPLRRSCNAAPAWLVYSKRPAYWAVVAARWRCVESMTRVQIGLGQNLSDWLRPVVQARSFSQRLSALRKLRPSDIRLFVPEVKNRVTGRSMGEHTEDMAKTWNIGRTEQDELALQSHRYAVAAQDRGFFADLIVPVDGVSTDHFPRRDP